jgi:hypothetical protein
VFFNQMCPQASGGSQLGDFHIKIHANAPKEGLFKINLMFNIIL